MAVNNAGWVVGTASTYTTGTPQDQRAFLCISVGNMQDLNTLVINLPTGVKLVSANAISNRGEIVDRL